MATPTREAVLEALRNFKEVGTTPETTLPVLQQRRVVGRLEPVCWADADRPDAVERLARWREGANAFFPAQFPVTVEGTRRWLVQGLLESPDRILFWVKAADGRPVGHVGLFRFDFDARGAEIDNIVRGEEGVLPGVIGSAIDALLGWGFTALGLQTAYLRVLSDNERALRLYRRLGFEETMRVPLAREQAGDVIRWVEVGGDYRLPVTRYFVTMRLPKAGWRAVRAA
jgi:RimJ/RimL family protein N-acetyltransferase